MVSSICMAAPDRMKGAPKGPERGATIGAKPKGGEFYGVRHPRAARQGGRATVARPIPSVRRLSVPTQVYATLVPVPLEAS